MIFNFIPDPSLDSFNWSVNQKFFLSELSMEIINFSCVNVNFFLIRALVTLVTIILDFYVVLVSKLETIALKKLYYLAL